VKSFADLAGRAKHQSTLVPELEAKVADMNLQIDQIQLKYSCDDPEVRTIQSLLGEIEEQHNAIKRQLIDVMAVREVHKLESLEFSAEEQKLADKLELRREEIDKPGQYKCALNGLRLKVERRRDVIGPKAGSVASKPLSEEDGALAEEALREHSRAIEQLTKTLKDLRRKIEAYGRVAREIETGGFDEQEAREAAESG
jgi:chromosome segregation ATPase